MKDDLEATTMDIDVYPTRREEAVLGANRASQSLEVALEKSKIFKETFRDLPFINVRCDVAMKQKIDLVFMDMEMPHMSGLEAVRFLRGKAFEKPIYVLTGNVSENAVAAAAEAGCQGHLSKPIDVAALSQVIESNFSQEGFVKS